MKEPEQLQLELEAFKRMLPSLKVHAGQFAVIVGETLHGTYSTWEDACKVGYKVAAGQPFLVKKVEDVETINHFHRDVFLPCHT